MFPLGFMLIIILEQILQEIEKSWSQSEHWYQIDEIIRGYKYTIKTIHDQLFLVNPD